VIPEEVVQAATERFWYVEQGPGGPDADPMRVALEAALPALRRQWAADLAQAIEDHPGPDPSPALPAWWAGYSEAQRDAARIVREFGESLPIAGRKEGE